MTDERIFTIMGLGSNGDGYTIVDDEKVFVPFTVNGDIVNIALNPKVKLPTPEIIQPSDHRIAPACQHFGQCGGCTLQHVTPQLYSEYKQHQIIAPLLAHQVAYQNVATPYFIGSEQRRRITLKAMRVGPHIKLGYHQLHTHNIIDILECPVAMPPIVKLFKPLRGILAHLLIKTKSQAEIAVLCLQSDDFDGFSLDVVITTDAIKKVPELNLREKLIDFARQNQLARLTLNHEVVVTFKKPTVAFAGIAVEADTKSFLQAGAEVDKLLAEIIAKNFEGQTFKRVADLFCGRGTLSLPLTQYNIVDGFEIDAAAIQALQKAIHQHNVSRLTLHKRNLFERPLSEKELQAYDCVVLNPPWAGAYTQAKNLAHSHVKRIIYLSCNPQTFARDAALLTADHYQLTSIIPIDQFHWSHHIELLGIFEYQDHVHNK